jgi:UDP-N-acetylmuramoyl-tripeptide--D-alanyl-D-alanine ligase
MMETTIARLTTMMTGAECAPGIDRNLSVCGVSTDTRSIQAGQLFVPLSGERFDGHDYALQAVANGAAALLWQRDRPLPASSVPLIFVDDTLRALQELAHAYRKQLGLKVVAVTGSNGKTTTKDIIAALLSTTFRVHKTPGNLNNHIGLPLTLLQCPADTQVLVAEMGMSGRGEIARLSQLALPDVAVITMIGEAHLEQLGSRAAIADAKMEIVDGLAPDGWFVYHGDEPLLRERLHVPAPTVKKVSFGFAAHNDVVPQTVTIEADGATFTLDGMPYHTPLLGEHNVLNTVAAMAVATRLGVQLRVMNEPLARLKVTGMRSEKVVTSRGVTILNDAYNASPASMRAALKLLGQLSHVNRKIVVLGDMLELGEQGNAFHEAIGTELDAERIAAVYTFGPLAAQLAARAAEHFPAGSVHACQDKTEIVESLVARLSTADNIEDTVILVKGSRGMKLEEVVTQLLSRL